MPWERKGNSTGAAAHLFRGYPLSGRFIYTCLAFFFFWSDVEVLLRILLWWCLSVACLLLDHKAWSDSKVVGWSAVLSFVGGGGGGRYEQRQL